MAEDGTVSYSTGQYNRHPEWLNSIHIFEKKKVTSLFGIQNDSVNQQNDSKILYLLSEEEETTTLGDFIESLTKAAVLLYFPVSSDSVPL